MRFGTPERVGKGMIPRLSQKRGITWREKGTPAANETLPPSIAELSLTNEVNEVMWMPKGR